MRYVADEVVDLGVYLGETCEIFVFKQQCGRFVHPLDVGCAETEVALLESEGIFPNGDKILVGALHSVETGVGAGLHGKDVEDDDFLGQKAVELVAEPFQPLGVKGLLQFEMGVVVGSVHSRVGAPATGHRDVLLMQQQ